MEGISDKAAGGLENRYKYNGIELDTSLGLDEYEATLRDLDPQTGRWWQIDPETEDQEMWSPYTSNNDNPIRYYDPRGNEGDDCCGGFVDKFVNAIKTTVKQGVVFIGSAANAFVTNQVGGIGRVDPNSYSDPSLAVAAQTGLTTGDGLTVLGTVTTDVGIGAGEVGTDGAITPEVSLLAVQQNIVALPSALKNLKNDFAATSSGRNVTKVYPTRKQALEARPKPTPQKPGEGQVTRQMRNKAGEGSKFKTDHGNQTLHVHDRNHNNKTKPNVHYRIGTKKIKPNE